jgi:hypothetical protein
MTWKKLLALAMLIGGLCVSPAWAVEYEIYPTPGVFLPPSEPADSVARKALPVKDFGDTFVKQMRAAFPNATDTITESKSKRTFVASLQVARVATFEIPKPEIGATSPYASVTASIYLTNIGTGEIVYAYTLTQPATMSVVSVAKGRAVPPAVYTELIRKSYAALVEKLVARARTDFRPFEVSATARKSIGTMMVVDQGTEAGIGPGDVLEAPDGATVKTVFTDPKYTVADALVGKVAPGQKLSRLSAKTVDELQRPTAVVAIGVNASDLPDEVIVQMATDAIAAQGLFNLIPVNRSFTQVLAVVKSKTQISGRGLNTRPPPQYYVRVSVLRPMAFEAPTGRKGEVMPITSARALTEVVDTAGRVAYAGAAYSVTPINRASPKPAELAAPDGDFNPVVRRERATREALTNLAAQMKSGLVFTQSDLKVANVSAGQINITDPKGLLAVGYSADLLQKVGRVGGLNNVMAPLWTVHVDGISDKAATVTPDLPVYEGARQPSGGDVFRVQQLPGASGRNAKRYGDCSTSASPGTRRIDGYDALALNRFAARSGQDLYLTRFVDQQAAQLEATGLFAKASLAVQRPAQTACVEPVHRIEPQAEVCAANICKTTVLIRLSYRLRSGQQVTRKGLERKITNGVYATTPKTLRAQQTELDWNEEALRLLDEIFDKSDLKKTLAAL